MRLKFGQLTLIPLGILLSLPSCGKKTEENEGFIPKLSELKKEDVITDEKLAANSLWDKVTAALKISDIDRESAATVTASLKVPSTYITDAALATQWAAARAGAIVGDAKSQKCSAISAMVDLVPGTSFGITGNGAFKLGGTDGKTPTKLLKDTLLDGLAGTITAKVYLMKYKLDGDTENRNAIVTIPDITGATLGAYPAGTQAALTIAPDTSSGHGYPIAFYAHAGATGLAYEEIAQTFGDLQASHIIVAPVFPGENFCATYDTNAAGQKTPSCTGTNIGSAAVGTSNPYTNDVTDLLGAFECIKANAASTSIPVLNAAGAATGLLPAFNTKFAKISATASSTAAAYSTALGGTGTANGLKAYKLSLVSAYPVAYAIGLGRGAAVANLAVGRGGALNSVIFSTATDETTVAAQTALTNASVTPGLFSCSIAASPHATFTAGLNKIILDYWVKGYTGFLSESRQAALSQIPGFANIKAKIDAIKAGTGTEDEIATAIATYIQSIDSTYHSGLIHGGLQNWGKVFTSNNSLFAAAIATAQSNTSGATAANLAAKNTLAAAQGSGLIMHGTSDVVANVSNSQLFSAIAVATSTGLEAATTRAVGGVNWLAVGIAPPTGVTVDGVTDIGHVSSVSFLTGKAVDAATSSMTSDSSFTIADYVDKTPVGVITKWLDACKTSVNAASVP